MVKPNLFSTLFVDEPVLKSRTMSNKIGKNEKYI